MFTAKIPSPYSLTSVVPKLDIGELRTGLQHIAGAKAKRAVPPGVDLTAYQAHMPGVAVPDCDFP